MEYYQILDLKREPFSNSPDPEFFYAAPPYQESLQRLEIAIRLRRGLNVVLGEVGTGKTTLSRVLLKAFEGEPDLFEVHLILDPGFHSDREMLDYLLRLLGGTPSDGLSLTALEDQLMGILFKKGVEQGKVVVLLVDEAQKLTPSGLEIIRELLNFECNHYKLLQVVTFAQMEFWDRVQEMRNLLDRVNTVVTLRPLSLHETRAMIHHRLVQAGMSPDRLLFTDRAVKGIHRAAGGHPRRIINICHHALLKALILGKPQVTASIVRRVRSQAVQGLPWGQKRRAWKKWGWAPAALLLAALAVVGYEFGGQLAPRLTWDGAQGTGPHETASEPALISDAVEMKGDPEVGRVEAPSVLPWQVKGGVWEGRQWFHLHPEALHELDSPTTVVVRRGETLSAIVERHYKVPLGTQLTRMIQSANPWLTDPDRLAPGETLVLPRFGGGKRGLRCQPLAWFVDVERAESWAAAVASTGEGPVFLVRARKEGGGSFAVAKGAAGFKGGHPSGNDPEDLVWVDEEDVLRVYIEP